MIPWKLALPGVLAALIIGEAGGRFIASDLLGRTGFAAVPYVRAVTLALVLSVLAALALPRLRSLSVMTRAWRPFQGLMLLLLAVMMVGMLVGPVRDASLLYLVTDSGYILIAVLLYGLGRNTKLDPKRADTVWFGTMGVAALAALLLRAADVAVPSRFPLLFTLTAFGALLHPSLWRKLLAAYWLAPVAVMLGGMNRAAVAALLTAGIGTVATLRPREVRTYVMSGLVAAALVVLAFPSIISPGSPLDRRLRELQSDVFALQVTPVSSGRSVTIPTEQRLFEAEVALATLERHAPWSYVFGMGSGATLDMRSSQDPSVTESALLGAAQVHNIHLLPVMLLYRYGGVGIVAFVALITTSTTILFRLRRWKRYASRDGRAPFTMTAVVVYIPAAIVFAIPAGGQLFADPLLFLFMGVADATLWRTAHSTVSATPAYRSLDSVRPAAPQ